MRSLPDDLSYPQKTRKNVGNLCWSGIHRGYSQSYPGLGLCQGLCWEGDALKPVQRQGAGYHSEEKEVAYASATSLRQHKEDQDFVTKFMPNSQLFQSAPQVSWEDYDQLLRYQILTHPDLTQIFQVNEELANRIKEAVRSTSSVEELVEKVATKRYTKARVRRILTYILVVAMDQALPDAIHVLGFSAKGQAHLKGLKNSVEIVTRIGKEPWDALTQQADQVYQLGNPRIARADLGSSASEGGRINVSRKSPLAQKSKAVLSHKVRSL